MENASKALLMAGGVLLAILILSVFVFMFFSVRNFYETQEQQKAEKQIATFNSEYEAYNKSVMYGTEVISVLNKASDYNSRKSEGQDIIIRVTNLDIIELNTHKTSIFQCVGITYDQTGRVSSMTFKYIR